MKLTTSRIRALVILAQHGPTRPRDFAERMWPDSSGWKRVHKCGPYGASSGAMMAMVGGAYLGKLRKAGLVDWAGETLHGMPLWGISCRGEAALEGAGLDGQPQRVKEGR